MKKEKNVNVYYYLTVEELTSVRKTGEIPTLSYDVGEVVWLSASVTWEKYMPHRDENGEFDGNIVQIGIKNNAPDNYVFRIQVDPVAASRHFRSLHNPHEWYFSDTPISSIHWRGIHVWDGTEWKPYHFKGGLMPCLKK